MSFLNSSTGAEHLPANIACAKSALLSFAGSQIKRKGSSFPLGLQLGQRLFKTCLLGFVEHLPRRRQTDCSFASLQIYQEETGGHVGQSKSSEQSRGGGEPAVSRLVRWTIKDSKVACSSSWHCIPRAANNRQIIFRACSICCAVAVHTTATSSRIAHMVHSSAACSVRVRATMAVRARLKEHGVRSDLRRALLPLQYWFS